MLHESSYELGTLWLKVKYNKQSGSVEGDNSMFIFWSDFVENTSCTVLPR